MALEEVAPGIASDGHGLVLWVPEAGLLDPSKPTVAELTDPEVVPLTYSLTPDGFTHEVKVAQITSGRYTLSQALTYDGKETHSVEVKYVWTGTASDVARVTLEKGAKGYIVHRLAVPNETEIAAAQLVDVIPVQCSVQRKVPPTENTELQRVQSLNVIGRVHLDVPVVAGP